MLHSSTLGSESTEESIRAIKVKLCPFYVFGVMEGVAESGGSTQNRMESRLLMLEAEMGWINHALVGSSPSPFSKPIFLKLHLFNVQEEYIETCLEWDKTAREVVEEVSAKNSLGTALDWGLFLFWGGRSVHIPNDERIMQVAAKWGVELEYTQERELPENLILKKIDSFKQWGAQLFSDPKGRIFFKKYLYL